MSVERPSSFLVCSFRVFGVPVPQGSKRAFVVQKAGGPARAVLADASRGLKPWRELVRSRAAAVGVAFGEHVPVRVFMRFLLPRGKSVKRMSPTTKPDLDKLVRAVNDALVDACVLRDDAQIVAITVLKEYATDTPDGTPGVLVQVQEMEGAR